MLTTATNDVFHCAVIVPVRFPLNFAAVTAKVLPMVPALIVTTAGSDRFGVLVSKFT